MYSTEDVRKVLILDKIFPKIITLCGSTKFKKEFLDQQEKLAEKGFLVLSVSFFSHSDGYILADWYKIRLDKLHKRKIDISDSILVINPGGYIGESTKSEIEYADKLGIEIDYLDKLIV